MLDGCAALIVALLGACPALRVLATSREPIAVAGEQIWRVPPLGHGEAIELFTDRAREARPELEITADNLALVTEICHRLDGIPLAIELAASRVRALALTEIVDSLHDRFRLLTGGSRSAPPADDAGFRRLVTCAADRTGAGAVSATGGFPERV
ncbi:conserved hypothetical protein [Mycobacterium tuberculosis T92]|nr:conserved hypothetical protein [Mycobacterium tuberculosis T92]